MMAALPLRPEDLASKYLDSSRAKPLSLGIATLDDALPDEGLPTGAVVEVCAPMGLGRATHLALCACAAAQREPVDGFISSGDPSNRGASRWTAWIDPSEPSRGSLFAPAIARAGVDLTRLLVVRPNPEDVARVSVRLATSRLFRLIVVDRTGVPGAAVSSRARWSTAVRRLALAAENSDTTILLLSSTASAHRDLLPTAMRIELTRPKRDELQLHVTKNRRGQLPGPVSVSMSDLTWQAAS